MTAANPFTCGTMLAPGLRPDPFFERAASCCSFANWANLIFFSAFSSSKTAATCWSTNSWPYCPQRVAIPSSWSMHPMLWIGECEVPPFPETKFTSPRRWRSCRA